MIKFVEILLFDNRVAVLILFLRSLYLIQKYFLFVFLNCLIKFLSCCMLYKDGHFVLWKLFCSVLIV